MRYRFAAMLLLAWLVPFAAGQDEPMREELLPTGSKRPVLTRNIGGHVGQMLWMFFSSDNKRLVTVGRDQTVQVWDLASGHRQRVLWLPAGFRRGWIYAAALHPTEPYLALSLSWWEEPDPAEKQTHSVVVIDYERGQVRDRLGRETAHPNALAYSPDGKRLAAAWGDAVRIWDSAKPGLPVSLPHDRTVICLAFSPDSKHLVTGDGKGKALVWWDLLPAKDGKLNFKQVRKLTTETGKDWHGVNRVAWSPDGKTIAVAEGASTDGIQLYSSDGKDPKSCARQDLGGSLKKYPGTAFFTGFAFLKDRPSKLMVHWGLDVDRDGQGLSGVTLLDTSTGKTEEIGTLPTPAAFRVARGAVSPDGTLLAVSGGYRNEIRVWRTTGAFYRELGAQEQMPLRAFWRADSKAVAWAPPGKRETPFLTEPKAGIDLETFTWLGQDAVKNFKHRTQTDTAGWSLRRPNKQQDGIDSGRVLVAERGSRKVVIDLKTDVVQFGLFRQGAQGIVRGFAISPTSVYLLDPEKDRPLFEYHGFQLPTLDVVPSPDGRFLMVTSGLQRITIYGTEKPQILLYLAAVRSEWIAWTPEGYYAASPGGESLMGWLVNNGPNELATFHPASRFRKQLNRPDIIRLVLEKGSVQAALKAAGKAEADPIKDLLPPAVKVQVDRTRLPVALGVRATATPGVAGETITSVQLILNDRPAPAADSRHDFGPAAVRGKPAFWEWKDVALPPGKHTLAVLARTENSTIVTDPVEVEGPKVKGPDAAQASLHILCIGVSEYANNDLNLKWPAKDADDMAAVLHRCAEIGHLFRPKKPTVLRNKEATRRGVEAALKKLVDDTEIGPSDMTVVFLSCHGDTDEKGDFWLLTHEADRTKPLKESCLSGEDLKSLLSQVPGRVLLLLDACHAAAIDPKRKNPLAPVTDGLAARLNDEDCAVAVLAAARGKEFALEAVENKITKKQIENGLFTWAVKRSLERALSEKPIGNPYDGRFYAHDLYQQVFNEVSYHSNGRQTPCYSPPWNQKPYPLLLREISPDDSK